MIRLFLALAAFLTPLCAMAQGAVSTAHPKASEAGQAILRQGGSATDAAMAMMLALTVVEPQSSGIGGGGFIVHHSAATGRTETIDGRETAPAGARPDRFLGPDGKPLGFMQAVPGGRSVGVPGNIRLMALAHQKWGRLPWPALFQPAIALAENGFPVSKPMAAGLSLVSGLWKDFPATAELYAPGGKPLAEGAMVKNPKLAALLRKIAAEGPSAFYTGDNARLLVDTVNNSIRAPGDMTLADLAGYSAKERPAVCTTYRRWKLCGMGPPSSGATTVFQILGMVERFDMKALGKDSPIAWHLISEAMLLAYADREMYLGDADFVAVPVKGLIDKRYIRSRSALLSMSKRLGRYEAGKPPGAPARTPAVQAEVPGTTHFVAVDGKGNVATMTSTIEGSFGSQLNANGFMLNNELTDFTRAPVQDGMLVANRPQGGKRPLSSMSPTIVYDAKGQPVFTVGAAGGKTIIMQVAKALIAHLDWGLSAREAIGEGLIYFNDKGLVLEQGTDRVALKAPLEAMGHTITVSRLGLKANAAERTAKGWVGAADPRSIGEALPE